MDLYVHFYTPSSYTINKEIKNKLAIILILPLCLQRRIQSFLGRLFTAGGLEAAVTPPMDSRESHNGCPGDKVPGRSEDLELYKTTYFCLKYTL